MLTSKQIPLVKIATRKALADNKISESKYYEVMVKLERLKQKQQILEAEQTKQRASEFFQQNKNMIVNH